MEKNVIDNYEDLSNRIWLKISIEKFKLGRNKIKQIHWYSFLKK